MMILTHLTRIHHGVPGPPYYAAWRNVVLGGNVPLTRFSSSRHDPNLDPACVANAHNYFYATHAPTCGIDFTQGGAQYMLVGF